MMLILGLDPGSTSKNPSGWAVVDTVADTVLAYGLLKPNGGAHLPDLACQLQRLLASAPYQLAHIAIEQPWIGPNVRTGLVLAELVGAYKAVAALAGLPVSGITPTQAKAALCDGRASKTDMRYTVKLRYGLAVPSHVADAIAVALASVTWPGQELTAIGAIQEPQP